jgi:Amt family ammonium transporter
MRRVDDTLGVFHTHGVAAVCGGLLTGLLADPKMLEYIGTDKDAPGVSVTGALFGNPHQFILQIYGAAFIIVLNVIGTFIILKLISLVTPLRMPEAMLKIGDDAVHGEEAYALYGDGSRVPVTDIETSTI